MADDHRTAHPAHSDGPGDWTAIGRLLAGECGPEESSRIRARLEADPARAAEIRSLDAAMALAKEPPLSGTEVDRALALVQARLVDDGPVTPIERRRTGASPRRPALRAAAAVILLAGGGLVWQAMRDAPSSGAPTAIAAAAPSFATAVGRLDSLRLPDGTRVVLGPRSVLSLGAGYGGATRNVALRGEAYFEVVHDDARPFVVHTGDATLRDVGTTFAVHGDSGADVRVWVTEGAVDVRATRPASGSPVVLQAGDLATVSAGEVSVRRGGVSSDDLAWMRGALVFRDAPIAQVREGLRRWYGLELQVADPTIASRRLTATFNGGSRDDVGPVLAAALGGTASRSGDTLRVGPPVAAPAR